MKPISYTIEENRTETPSTKSLILDGELDADPGQYYMVWVKGVDEIPISPSSLLPPKLTVRGVGEATDKLNEMDEGEKIGLRGPFGSSFDLIGEKILFVAGGVGAAPLLPLVNLAKEKDTTIALGAITEKELLFRQKFEGLGDLIVSTEDGSSGHHGYITEPLFKKDLEIFDSIYSCGPEPMMYKIFEKVKDKDVFAQFSLHRHIKCGVGLCGSCCIDPSGLRVCKEGPIFEKKELIDTEFGEYRRDGSGKKINLIGDLGE